MKTTPEKRLGTAGFVLHSCVLAGLFLHIELVKSFRSSFWDGGTPEEWAGTALAGVLLAAVIAAVAQVLLLAWRVVARRPASPWSAHVSLSFSGLLSGALLAFSGVPVTVLEVLFGAGCIVVIGMGCLAFPRIQWHWLVMWMIALVLATLASSAFAHVALTVIQIRAAWCKVLSPTFLLGSIAILAFCHWLTARMHGKLLARIGTVCILTVLSLLPAALFAHSSSDPFQAGPNLVFIVCDALRADVCSPYGGPVPTPALETIAREGVLFENAVSLAPWTIPSMTGMFASTHPPDLPAGGTREEWKDALANYRFPQETPTISELLRSSGYATAAFIGNPVLGDPDGILRGFSSRQVWPCHAPLTYGPFRLVPRMQAMVARVAPRWALDRPVDSNRLLVSFTRRFLDIHGDGSFFLWLHFIDPHDPYAPPERFVTMDGPWPLFAPVNNFWKTPQLTDAGEIAVLPEHQPYVRHLYEGEIQYVDECIGSVLGMLADRRLADNTFVVYTSDHGEEFWDHGGYGHGQSLHSEQVHVPLAIQGPGIQGGQRIPGPFSHLDLMPTLAELLGLEPPVEWKGSSFAPFLLDPDLWETAPRGHVFANATNRYAWPLTWHMVQAGDDKLMVSQPDNVAALYDLATDPGENRDVALQEPEKATALKRKLEEWRATTPLDMTLPDTTDTDLEEMKSILENMGYL
jgi:arylsulfatase A-like enzyme